MKVKLIEYPFGKQLPGCDQDIVWFIKTVDEDNHAMTCFWYQDKPLFVSNFDLHIAAYCSSHGNSGSSNSGSSNWSIGTFASDPFGVSPSSWNSF